MWENELDALSAWGRRLSERRDASFASLSSHVWENEFDALSTLAVAFPKIIYVLQLHRHWR